jgi:predicted Zn-dependent protease
VALPGLLVGGIFQGPMAQAVATPFIAGGMLLTAQYSQGHESEADKQGIALAAKAGYKPIALSAILARLSAEVELLTGQAEEKNYFASHPYTPKRVANIKKTAEKLTVAEGENVVAPLDFLARFNTMPLSANPEFGYVKNDVLYHPASGLQVDVPNGWKSQTTPEALGLMNEKGDAMLTAEVALDSLSATKYLQKMEKAMLQQAGAKAEKSEKINWHGYEGGMLEYSGTNQGKALKVQLYVLDFKGKLLKIAAAFYTEKQGEVEHVLKTAKPLIRAELPAAEVKRLRIARAVAGETLAQFAERYNATEFLKFMAVINDLAENAMLTAGQEIKWIELDEVRFE